MMNLFSNHGISREARIKLSVRPEPVEGLCYGLIVIDLIHSWFDKLTTNGLNLRFPRQRLSGQRGSTLLVALIMLVLLTLIAISAMQSTTSSIQVVGNAQFREEAYAAAQRAMELVISNGNFQNGTPAPQTIDVNQDTKADYTVTFNAPQCLTSSPTIAGTANLPTGCTGAIQCFWTTWDISAVVNDVQTGAGVVLHQGVRNVAFARFC